MKGLYTIMLLLVSNTFMTFAWYGHLKAQQISPKFSTLPIFVVIIISWLIALFEYCAMVPANRLGFVDNGGPFTLFQLKIIQEVISLTVFTLLAILLFKTETFRLNYLWSFLCLVGAVFFAFKK
ncbi:MAG: DMT family protein [Tidjanibacter sp.]|nr:DMT family protein [Tidjanibacter sp.]MBR4037421.1 DMT family protein [Tidjanibacter sp.]MBR4065004.1 DMT family protein [Tidjanibacter sp.]MBR7102374.1 DMT family protein [Tidjanibacter sp.]